MDKTSSREMLKNLAERPVATCFMAVVDEALRLIDDFIMVGKANLPSLR